MPSKNDEKKKPFKLDWRDYIAFTIALLETSLLPIVLVTIGLFIIVVILGVI